MNVVKFVIKEELTLKFILAIFPNDHGEIYPEGLINDPLRFFWAYIKEGNIIISGNFVPCFS